MIRRLAWLAVIGYFALFALGITGLGFAWSRRDRSLEQPVPFGHERHAGQLKIACTHCHRYPDRGARATVPAMSVCAECHGEMVTDNPEIRKLQEFLGEKRPVEWRKVHDLPWHVHFTHKRHIRAGVDCWVCHGEVQAMTRMRQVRSLEMGWCVNCHRKEGAPTDCWTCHQ